MAKFGIALEIAVVFALLMCQIWLWQEIQILAAVPIVLIFISWYLRSDTLKTLGIVPQWPSKKMALTMFAAFGIFWLIVLVCGMVWNPKFFSKVVTEEFWYKYARMFCDYYLWALFQQLWVCGFFANRLSMLFNNDKKAIVATGLLFMLVHFPNPVLMIATLIGGILSAYFFLNMRNLYLIALAHAILGPTIRLFLDYSLRIGPGFLSWFR